MVQEYDDASSRKLGLRYHMDKKNMDVIEPLPIPKNLMDKARASPKKEAQNLRCGDVFLFRDNLYVCLMSFTDRRHTQTIITAVEQQDSGIPMTRITALRLYRTFEMPVCHHIKLSLQDFDNTNEEIRFCSDPRMEGR